MNPFQPLLKNVTALAQTVAAKRSVPYGVELSGAFRGLGRWESYDNEGETKNESLLTQFFGVTQFHIYNKIAKLGRFFGPEVGVGTRAGVSTSTNRSNLCDL